MAAVDLIIFGASGDLSARKLFPALFQLERLNAALDAQEAEANGGYSAIGVHASKIAESEAGFAEAEAQLGVEPLAVA